ncbi:MAG: hypothetical protein JNM21_14480 [Taibaiella sp.]|nr:hypothetical protein [Taibaiella sp.]
MKRIYTIIVTIILTTLSARAQNNVGINNTNPDPSAALLIDTAASGPQGMLIPRMTQARRNAIASPATGLMLYQTDNNPGFYFYNGSAWAAVGGAGGATLDLLVTKTNNAQILSLANGTNTGDLVTFNNVVTSPTLGSYNTTTNEYTVGVSGLYMIQAVTRCEDHPTPTNTVPQFLFVDVDAAGIGSPNTIITDYPTITSSNLPAGSKGRGFTQVTLYLTAGQKVRILGLGANSSTATRPLLLNQSCKFMVVKL